MRRIMVATDFSTRSDRAMRRATLIAKSNSAELLLLHVLDDDRPMRLLDPERRLAQDLLFDLSQTIRSTDRVQCRFDVQIGEPFSVIPEMADREAADLVVLGPHRRMALRDVFAGTTAERTVARALVPILMANAVPSKPYENVLVATDLSEGSAAAAEGARRLGFLDVVTTRVVHVVDAPAEGLVSLAGTPSDRRDYLQEEEARATVALTDFLEREDLSFSTSAVRFARSSAADSIIEVARETGADLLVLGKEGRSAMDRLVLGSVVGEVLRRAELDVLVVPRDAARKSNGNKEGVPRVDAD